MNRVHQLADRFQKYLVLKKIWLPKRWLIELATSNQYTEKEAAEATNLLEDNPYPYEYCRIAKRTAEGRMEFIAYEMTPEEIARKKDQFEWFDLLPEVKPPAPVVVDTRPQFGKPNVKTSKRRHISTK